MEGKPSSQRERMLRKACGSFALMVADERPGDPEVEKPFSLEDVFGWYRDCPEQIERAVIFGSRLALIAREKRIQLSCRRAKGKGGTVVSVSRRHLRVAWNGEG